jgi:FAD/FMN-containing dehydrogenase
VPEVNDVHSRLNATTVARLEHPGSADEVAALVREAARDGVPVAVCGGRHAMGGQQFAAGALQLDLSRMDRVRSVDASRRTAHVEAGAQWPQVLDGLERLQRDVRVPLTFRQKQTGADRLSIGGAVAANAHGRGLRWPPFVSEVASLRLVDARGELVRCSRRENPELFRLVVGGYGLFGVVVDVELRLVPVRRMERVVEVTTLDEVAATFDERIREDFEYGDFQFLTDPHADGFMNRGVLSCYRPVGDDRPLTDEPVELAPSDWERLLVLAHADKGTAFAAYASHYRKTHGQVYRSDLMQLGVYVDGYHGKVDQALRSAAAGSEMITEAYVPRDGLTDFMRACRRDFRAHDVDFIYGTIRLIEEDEETFLPWARKPWACVVFNLHVRHDAAGLEKAKSDFRRIDDRAIELGGSFFLTYHRWSTRERLLAAHPALPAFLAEKRRLDPEERFQSDCYRHLVALFRDG